MNITIADIVKILNINNIRKLEKDSNGDWIMTENFGSETKIVSNKEDINITNLYNPND